jgi:hypothetical protein
VGKATSPDNVKGQEGKALNFLKDNTTSKMAVLEMGPVSLVTLFWWRGLFSRGRLLL